MDSEKLTISLVQTSLFWHDRKANLAQLSKKINEMEVESDLIILPEMFTSGFTMEPSQVADSMDGETIKWMREMASHKNAAMIGSIVIREGKNFYNRLLFVSPKGTILHYDKKHTFTLAGEDKIYEAGTTLEIIEYKNWKICPLICYDLRFPVWSRNTSNYDLLIYVANWPEPRINAWDALLKARAIENMAVCVGVNRIGEDENGHNYVGHSSVYDVLGDRKLFMETDAIATITLSKKDIYSKRQKLRFLEDRDEFILK
ncbi:amidohydrolase [Ascidiimonas sp. W6]|uniref:amidohydrolase n=1 Tax=Ascidiimonas meishanensis TaxID=3128903 RepID=UPI0030EF8AFF